MVNKTSNKPYSGTLVSEVLDMRDLRAISGPSEGGSGRVDSGVILGSILGQFWTLSRKPHRNLRNCLHLAVGRALSLKYTKIWVLGGGWVVPGIATLPAHPRPTTPGTPSPAMSVC